MSLLAGTTALVLGLESLAAGGTYRVYNSLVTRAVRELAAALNATGATVKAAHYRATADGDSASPASG